MSVTVKYGSERSGAAHHHTSDGPAAPWPEAQSVLGEGPCWRGGILRWVDVRAGRIWAARPGRRAAIALELAEPVSAVVPTAGGSFLVTGRHAVYHWDGASRSAAALVRLPDEPAGNRCNEARCDPWGNLWVGTMDDAGRRASGALWCLTREGQLEKVLDGMGIPNTLAWDVARQRLYLADSAMRRLDVFDFDSARRRPSGQRPFLADGPGTPDGSALDDAGCLWHARWDGGCVLRIEPSGHVAARVPLPVARPTSCAFGEPGTLFVTTAQAGAAPAAGSMDGAVLSLRVDAAGREADAYAGPTQAAAIRIGRTTALAQWREA
jgi:sugar lactone lactonase YvrE